MGEYRLSHIAQTDIVAILAWSEEQFGAEARGRYGTLIATAIRDACSHSGEDLRTTRPNLGAGVFTWHVGQSRTRPLKGLFSERDTFSFVADKPWSSQSRPRVTKRRYRRTVMSRAFSRPEPNH